MKKFPLAVLSMILLVSAAWSSPWGIILNSNTMNFHIVDFGASPPRLYGPFLSGVLGQRGESLLDVAISPDNSYALLTNFYGHRIYKIDISDPLNPRLIGSLSTGDFAPEDIEISANGRFAVITDGWTNISAQVIFLDPVAFNNYSLYTIRTSSGTVQAVSIGKDNSTIVFADYYKKRIIYGRTNSTFTGLLSESTLDTQDYPINIGISPDGATLLVANPYGGSINIFQITGPGVLVPGTNPQIRGFHEWPQSIAFTPDGKRAYLVCDGTYSQRDTFGWLQVNGPGIVTMGGERIATLNSYSYSDLLGVDVLGISPDGKYAIAGSSVPEGLNSVPLINLTNFQVTQLNTGQNDAAGVATFNDAVFAPINLGLSRVVNNYIFSKEYINRLSWQLNPKNRSVLATYRLYRKPQGEADSSYQMIAQLDSSILAYDDRGLKQNAVYTYRVTSVNVNGLESPPVEISN